MCPADKPTLQELGAFAGARANLLGADWLKWCEWIGINTLAVQANDRVVYAALLAVASHAMHRSTSSRYFAMWNMSCKLEETLTWKQQQKVYSWLTRHVK